MIKAKKWDVYWKLTLTGAIERRLQWKSVATYVECVCECWAKKWICLNSLRRWITKGCWCQNYSHLMSKTRIYHIYDGICQRCTNSRCREWLYYWGKWVKNLWNGFEDFYRDMWESYEIHVKEYGERETTIDRIDSNWDYCKENCRWATRKEQNNNLTSNRKFVYKGKMYQTLTSLCATYWISKPAVKWRLEAGWTIEKAMETPLQIHHKKEWCGDTATQKKTS